MKTTMNVIPTSASALTPDEFSALIVKVENAITNGEAKIAAGLIAENQTNHVEESKAYFITTHALTALINATASQVFTQAEREAHLVRSKTVVQPVALLTEAGIEKSAAFKEAFQASNQELLNVLAVASKAKEVNTVNALKPVIEKNRAELLAKFVAENVKAAAVKPSVKTTFVRTETFAYRQFASLLVKAFAAISTGNVQAAWKALEKTTFVQEAKNSSKTYLARVAEE